MPTTPKKHPTAHKKATAPKSKAPAKTMPAPKRWTKAKVVKGTAIAAAATTGLLASGLMARAVIAQRYVNECTKALKRLNPDKVHLDPAAIERAKQLCNPDKCRLCSKQQTNYLREMQRYVV